MRPVSPAVTILAPTSRRRFLARLATAATAATAGGAPGARGLLLPTTVRAASDPPGAAGANALRIADWDVPGGHFYTEAAPQGAPADTGYLVSGRLAALIPAFAVVAVAAVVVAPWVVRNQVSVGCFTLTTDGRALWKANNPNTLRTLEHGGWIDDVPPIPGAPPTPQDAGDIYRRTGRVVPTNECAQMRFYRHRALHFMTDHQGEKAKLAGVAARMLWQPSVTRTEGRSGKGTFLDTARTWVEPAYMVVLYALALAGALVLPRRLLALALLLLAYDTLAAMLFAGETRYRIPWDFLLALAAAAGALELATRLRRAREVRA